LTPALGHAAEQGVLLTALAGLLNLLAIIDVSYCDPAFRRSMDSRRTASDAGAQQPVAPGEALDSAASELRAPAKESGR
jgi:hypothetical protein